MEEAMSDNSLIHDLECNHRATGYAVSIYSRALAEIDRLRAELAAAKEEARLAARALKGLGLIPDRKMEGQA
jgi:hypothetical protein